MQATNLTTWIAVEVEADGAALPPTVLAPRALVAALGATATRAKDTVTIGRRDDGRPGAIVAREGRRFTLTAQARLEDCPAHPALPRGAVAVYKGAALADALRWLVPAASTDETRVHLCAVSFEDHAAVTTDGHRLHKVGGLPAFKALAARGTVEIVRAALSATGADRVVARANGSRVAWTLAGAGLRVTVVGKVLDATFPPWKQVVPDAFDTRVTVQGGALREALETARAVAPTRTWGVRLRAAADLVTVATDNPDTGEFLETLPATVAGPERRVGLNALYLRDALPSDEAVEIRLSGGELDPITIAAGHRLAVLMPMRI